MTVVTAIYYDLLAERYGRPPLSERARDVGLRSLLGDSVVDSIRASAEAYEMPELVVRAMSGKHRSLGDLTGSLATDDDPGGEFAWRSTGLGLVSEVERAGLASGLEPGERDARSRWDMWERADGSWLLLPGDGRRTLSLALTSLHGHRDHPVIRLRRMTAATLQIAYGKIESIRLADETLTDVLAGRCEVDLTIDHDDRLYKGECVDNGCGSTCPAIIHVDDGTGVQSLVGCRCPQDADDEAEDAVEQPAYAR